MISYIFRTIEEINAIENSCGSNSSHTYTEESFDPRFLDALGRDVREMDMYMHNNIPAIINSIYLNREPYIHFGEDLYYFVPIRWFARIVVGIKVKAAKIHSNTIKVGDAFIYHNEIYLVETIKKSSESIFINESIDLCKTHLGEIIIIDDEVSKNLL